ncbi:hypothetical protein ACVWZR_005032 [Bradyrhizobium sp. i1.3.1]
MSTIDTGLTLLKSAAGRVSAANGWMGNAFKGWMPTGLYARALLIMIVPMVILQSVVAFVFMERHWNTVTRRLSAAVVQDIAALIDVYKGYPQDKDRNEIRRIAQQRLGLVVDFLPAGDMPPPGPKPFFSLLDQTLSVQLGRQIGRSFWIDTVGRSNLVEIRIQLDDAVMRVFAQRSAAYASNSEIFLFWMVGTSSILLIVAVLFLRNQIKPILRLADAAESFGKGREAPNFRPRGAREVRRAAVAFLEMKSRIERTMGAAHRDASRRQPRSAHHPDPVQARAGADWRQPRARRHAQGRRRDVDDAGGLPCICPRRFRRAIAADRHGAGARGTAQRRRAPRPHRDRRVPRPARGDREAGLVQALPRQPRHQRGALRQEHRHQRPARSPLFDRHGRGRRPRHSRALARRGVQAVPPSRQRPQPGRRAARAWG